MMNRLIASAIGLLLATSASAKIGDCHAVVTGLVTYRSHDNFVEAVRSADGFVIWHVVLGAPMLIPGVDRKTEDDAQWTIACVRGVKDGIVEATFGSATIRLRAKDGSRLPAHHSSDETLGAIKQAGGASE
jgi:hypothetical protein